jgi:hypothetical protein
VGEGVTPELNSIMHNELTNRNNSPAQFESLLRPLLYVGFEPSRKLAMRMELVAMLRDGVLGNLVSRGTEQSVAVLRRIGAGKRSETPKTSR